MCKQTDHVNTKEYINNFNDLTNAFGYNQDLATKHYLEPLFAEGRVKPIVVTFLSIKQVASL